MAEPVNRTVGIWSRFDRYEIRDGYIRPVPGAPYERYDPWEAYHASLVATPGVLESAGAPSPYASLLDLLREVQKEVTFSLAAPGRPYTISPKGEQAIVAWCQTYGLLGILPQLVQMVTLTARWRAIET